MYKTKEELEVMHQQYLDGTLPPTPKEKLVINPKVAYHVTSPMIYDSIPFKSIEKLKMGAVSRFSMTDPVDNQVWDYLYFVDSDIFRPAAIAFRKSIEDTKNTNIPPAYTRLLKGTKAYKDFWEEEFLRIKYGYEPEVDGKPCGLKIPGEFYFYLNYGWIRKLDVFVDEESGELDAVDKSDLPDFLAMDYFYFKELDSRENPKKYGFKPSYKRSIPVAKSRRKGFSYKAAAGAVWVTAFNTKAGVIIASDTGEDAALCFDKAADIYDHLTKYTEFGREDIGIAKTNGGWKHAPISRTLDTGYLEMSIINTRTGEREGRQSFIKAVSLHNKADAAAGQGLSRVYFEESGKCSNLSAAWNFTYDTLRVGSIYRAGIAILFGTGGEMVSKSGKKGGSHDFSVLFNKPDAYGLASYNNIYEYRESAANCGLFISDLWFNPGALVYIDDKPYRGVDRMGNACFWVAELVLNKEREMAKPPNGKKEDYERMLTQRCKTPSEAFYVVQGTRFQVEDLINRQTDIALSPLGFAGLRIPGELVESDGFVNFVPKPDLEPIVSSAISRNDREGCLLRYEAPQKVKGKIPDDAYIISVDPIGQNTEGGESLVGIIVYKTAKYLNLIGDEKIVATYWGRKNINPQDYMHRLLLKLSKYYNAKITFENDRDGGILQYFIKINELSRLMSSPVVTMAKNIPNSKASLREFGHSCATSRHKDIGENLIYEWLSRKGSTRRYYDTDTGEQITEESVTNLDKISDQFLLEQLINYNRDGNFDAVSTLMGVMFQMEEIYDPELDYESQADIENSMSRFYKTIYGGSRYDMLPDKPNTDDDLINYYIR